MRIINKKQTIIINKNELLIKHTKKNYNDLTIIYC